MISANRRRGFRAIIAALFMLDGVLFVAFAFRREAPPAEAPVAIAPTDPRVAPVFTALEGDGLGVALELLEQGASVDSLVLRSGHQLAHALGRRALIHSGGDAGILRSCRPAFASGCYHGVVETLLKLRGRIDMGELQGMCAAAGSADVPGPVYECVHGLGHGVLGAVGMDVTMALRHCDSLQGARFDASCHEGVFMEAIASALKEAEHERHPHGPRQHSQAAHALLDPGSPYTPCDRYSDPYAESCWLFQGFVILRTVAFDPGLALGVCDSAPDGRAGRCYESVGHQVAGLFQRGDSWIIEQCARGTPELASRCASGAALALASVDWSGRRVVGFCSAVPNAWTSDCVQTATEMLGQVASLEQRSALCGRRLENDAICRALNQRPAT